MPFKLFKRKKEEPQEGPVLWQAGATNTAPVQEEKHSFINGIPVSPAALQGHGKIISVQCAKKGDGAGTVSVNLAALLAITNPERVVLIDLDGYGSVRSRLGLMVDHCLVNILDWEDVHTPREMAGRMQEHSSGIMVIPGVVRLDDVQKVTPSLVFKTLTLLKEHYDYIVVACPPVGVDNSTWAAALVSDMIFTVIKPDRASLDLVSENNKFMIRLGCQDRVRVVLNQAGMPGGIRPGDLVDNDKLGLNIQVVLPYSLNVVEANNRRQLIVLTKRKDEFSQALQGIVHNFKFRSEDYGY
ncbi:MAG: Sporulation initiation inhibitor protein Soj [Pelotomaculum sp. PtaB.Bin104]|nr:MAG: Sporulation initiation inhibitor protein Soj [Pelotomaculum sp. PtaB.Bin104]